VSIADGSTATVVNPAVVPVVDSVVAGVIVAGSGDVGALEPTVVEACSVAPPPPAHAASTSNAASAVVPRRTLTHAMLRRTLGSMAPTATPRGRAAVEAALIDATAELLAERGAARVSVRDIADRAGVNKGQIHHYFGGKQALVEAAFRKMATDHFRNAHARAGGGFPVPLTLGLDSGYLQALTRLVLDGELDIVGLEFDEGISVPRAVIERLANQAGLAEPSLEHQVDVAATMALEMGWAVFAPFILRAVHADDDTTSAAIVDGVRRRVRSAGKAPRGSGDAPAVP
jgi:AcrR family transcriptional regulator